MKSIWVWISLFVLSISIVGCGSGVYRTQSSLDDEAQAESEVSDLSTDGFETENEGTPESSPTPSPSATNDPLDDFETDQDPNPIPAIMPTVSPSISPSPSPSVSETVVEEDASSIDEEVTPTSNSTWTIFEISKTSALSPIAKKVETCGKLASIASTEAIKKCVKTKGFVMFSETSDCACVTSDLQKKQHKCTLSVSIGCDIN